MIKTLLIVDVDNHLNRANYIIRKFNAEETLILYLNNKVINNSFDYTIAEDLIAKDYFLKTYKEVKRLAKSWYKPLENQLRYFNISLGELIELEFMNTWPVFFKIDIILNLIKNKKPKKIYLITEYDEDINILNEIIISTKLKFNHIKLNHIKFNTKLHKKTNVLRKFYAKLQNLHFKISSFRISKKNKILFMGNLRQSLPIFKKLKKNKNNIIIRAGENLGRGLFSKNFDYYITFSEFSTPKINKKLKRIKKEFTLKWNLIKNNEEFKNKLFYKIPLFSILEKDLEYFFLGKFVSSVRYIETMKTLEKKVDIVVTQNDLVPFEKTVVQTANRLNIPTLTTIDGTLSDNIIKKRETDHILPSSQKIALFSDNQKQVILKEFKSEISKDRLVVTGFPIFDEYSNSEPKLNKEKLSELLGTDKNKKIILYIAEQYSQKIRECSLLGLLTKKQHEKRYIELFNLVKEIPNSYLIIKPHPSGSLEDSLIKDIAHRMKVADFTIIRNIDIYSLVDASAVVITRLSTVGLEAMILKKPVIIFDTYSGTNDYFDYKEFGAALHAKKPGDLRKIVKNLLKNKSIQRKLQCNMGRFINKNYNKNDGNASRRVADLIEAMIIPKR